MATLTSVRDRSRQPDRQVLPMARLQSVLGGSALTVFFSFRILSGAAAVLLALMLSWIAYGTYSRTISFTGVRISAARASDGVGNFCESIGSPPPCTSILATLPWSSADVIALYQLAKPLPLIRGLPRHPIKLRAGKDHYRAMIWATFIVSATGMSDERQYVVVTMESTTGAEPPAHAEGSIRLGRVRIRDWVLTFTRDADT